MYPFTYGNEADHFEWFLSLDCHQWAEKQPVHGSVASSFPVRKCTSYCRRSLAVFRLLTVAGITVDELL